MKVETLNSLRLTRTIAASRQAVFDAWTRPQELKRWACPQYATVDSVDVNLEVGGSYRIEMHVEGETHTAYGSYREIEPPSRLVYTWDWEGPHAMGVETIVTVEFVEVEGGTEVRLMHEGFPTEEITESHREGWSSCLDGLEALVA